jgi:predicted dehydrogenase
MSMNLQHSISIEEKRACPPFPATEYSRRRFLGGTLAAAASAPLLGAAATLAADTPALSGRKIKLGLVGCGGRGKWIGGLFKRSGGYDLHAVADYFPQVVDRGGEDLGVDKARRFSGLSGYQKVIESGVEAVALIVPPCFLAEQASAAVAAGLHVYMCKPCAVDMHGCLRIEAAGKLATQKQQVFLVDYQMPTDPVNIQVAERIRRGAIGKLAKVTTLGYNGGRADPPKTANIESRLQQLIWDNDMEIGGSFVVSYDIHAIDAAVWLVGRRPIAASGSSRIFRLDPHGTSHDSISVVYDYGDGMIHEHSGMALPNTAPGYIRCTAYGQNGWGVIDYTERAGLDVRHKKPFTGAVVNLYEAGAVRNIATFHNDVVAGGRYENLTVRRAVDGCLTCILGREAALRHGHLTMDQLLKENRRVEVDLSGLKV